VELAPGRPFVLALALAATLLALPLPVALPALLAGRVALDLGMAETLSADENPETGAGIDRARLVGSEVPVAVSGVVAGVELATEVIATVWVPTGPAGVSLFCGDLTASPARGAASVGDAGGAGRAELALASNA
jgi:hypothetical protein